MPIESGLTFFTSDSRPKYANDVLNVLALPVNTRYQFRYESKYILPEIRNIFDNLSPIGTRCLIAFRHEISEKSGTAFIVPIRWASIESIEFISDFYIIRFWLNGYPTSSSIYGVEKSQISNSSVRYLESCHGAVRALPVHLGLTSLVEPKERQNRDTWLTIAKSLALHTTFSETHFLRVTGVTNNLDHPLKFSKKNHYTVSEHQYVFVQIDYFALNYSKNNAKLTINSDTNVIRLAGGSNISLDSRYDSHRVWLQARAVVGSTMTEVLINTEDERNGAAQTRFVLPFEVVRSHRALLVRILINTTGAMLVAVPGILGPSTDVSYRVLIACLGALVLALGTNLVSSGK